MADKFIINNAGVLAEREARVTSSGASDAGRIVALDSTGKLHTSVMPVGIGADTKSIPASENLSAGDFVNVFNDNGTLRVRKADASSPNAGKRAHGFVLEAVASGNNAAVYFEGTNTQLSGLTPGATYFLSGTTPGGVVATAPTTAGYCVQEVGVAVSETEISFEPQQPIILA